MSASGEIAVMGWCGCSPSNGFEAEAWFARKRLERGDCPCCGGRLAEWDGDDEHPEGGECDIVAEGVLICGECYARGHVQDGPARESLLRALLPAPDPWERMYRDARAAHPEVWGVSGG